MAPNNRISQKWNSPGYCQGLLALHDKHEKVYVIDSTKIANAADIPGRINLIMQATFFQLSDIMSVETATSSLKKSVIENYVHQGKAVVDSKLNAIDNAISGLTKIDVPEEWGSCDTVAPSRLENVDALALTGKVIFPIMELKGARFKVPDFFDKHQCFLPRLWEQLNTKIDVLPHLFL